MEKKRAPGEPHLLSILQRHHSYKPSNMLMTREWLGLSHFNRRIAQSCTPQINYGQIWSSGWKDAALCVNIYRFVCDHTKYINTYAYTSTSLLVVRYQSMCCHIETQVFAHLDTYMKLNSDIHITECIHTSSHRDSHEFGNRYEYMVGSILVCCWIPTNRCLQRNCL